MTCARNHTPPLVISQNRLDPRRAEHGKIRRRSRGGPAPPEAPVHARGRQQAARCAHKVAGHRLRPAAQRHQRQQQDSRHRREGLVVLPFIDRQLQPGVVFAARDGHAPGQPVFGLQGVAVVSVVGQQRAPGQVVVQNQRQRQAAQHGRQRRGMAARRDCVHGGASFPAKDCKSPARARKLPRCAGLDGSFISLLPSAGRAA